MRTVAVRGSAHAGEMLRPRALRATCFGPKSAVNAWRAFGMGPGRRRDIIGSAGAGEGSGDMEMHMKRTRLGAKVGLLAGAAAIVGMATMTACGSDTKEPPTDTKAPTGSSAPKSPASLTPTEKVNVGSFAPTNTANRAPTVVPGGPGAHRQLSP